MNKYFISSSYGSIELHKGSPPNFTEQVLPSAEIFWAQASFGKIILQEIVTDCFLIQYFIFSFLEKITMMVQAQQEGLQSLLLLKGQFVFQLTDAKKTLMREGQFLLLNAGGRQTKGTIPAGKEVHLFTTAYLDNAYKEMQFLFPSLERVAEKSKKEAHLLFNSPKPVRPSVLNVVRELLFDTYQPHLQAFYYRLRIKQALFTFLAQTYSGETKGLQSLYKKTKVDNVRDIIEADISRHFTNKELAKKVHWSESSLKRAFQKEFGTGMYEYLRRLRMTKAHEMLSAGEQVKVVALTVGMRPSHFTVEFQHYYGYKATSLQRRED